MKKILVIFFLSLSILSVLAQKAEPVKIGLLIQDKNWKSAQQGAELAVNQANMEGGLNGRPFQLVVKSMEGPWGTGSKQAVDLIFQDEVWALLGSHDGRNGHLVEQAATKSIVVFVSSWTSDATLSQAFVPWFFNVVPTDIQQGQILYHDLASKKGVSHIAIISDQSYDSKQSVKGFQRTSNEQTRVKSSLFTYEEFADNPNRLTEEINKSGAQAILLFCGPEISFKVLSVIRAKKMRQVIYTTITALNEDILSPQQLKTFNGVLVASGTWNVSDARKFTANYIRNYHQNPGMVAYFSYDAARLLIEALKKSGINDREDIESALSTVKFNGLTGIFTFDKLGNRSIDQKVTVLTNGIPANLGN